MTDEEDIAILAGMNGQFLRQTIGRDRGAGPLITGTVRLDPRKFLNGGGYPQQPPQGYPQHPQYHPQGYPPPYQHNPYQQQPPPQQGQYDMYTPPDTLPGTIPSLLQLPTNDKGEVVIADEYKAKLDQIAQAHSNVPTSGSGFNIDNTQSFNVPGFDPTKVSTFTEQFDEVKKELKLLRRAVNTLTNLLRKTILVEDQPTPPPTNTNEIDS